MTIEKCYFFLVARIHRKSISDLAKINLQTVLIWEMNSFAFLPLIPEKSRLQIFPSRMA